MLAFLAVYTLIFFAVHGAVFLRALPVIPRFKGRWYWLAGLTVVMTAAPVISVVLQRQGQVEAPAVLSWAAFLWMGLLLLAFAASIDSWILEGLWRLWRKLRKRAWSPRITRVLALAPLVFALAGVIYGSWEVRQVQVEKVTVVTDKLPASHPRIRVALVSDIHLGVMVSPERLKGILDIVRAQKPDIFIAAGDIVDGIIPDRGQMLGLFQAIKPPLGNYAIMGNHEFYVGEQYCQDFLNQAGFTILRDQAVTVGGVINLAGVDDPARNRDNHYEVPVLNKIKNGLFTILIKHRPRVVEQALSMFDLQLSGHTHGGQVFPFRYIVRIPYPLIQGLYDLGGKTWLFTTVGAGTWGPPMRVFTPPEVAVVDIVREP